MFISAIIPAAGSGVRFGDKKQFKVINGNPLIYHTLKPFLESNMINEVVVVASEQDMGLVKIILSLKPSKKYFSCNRIINTTGFYQKCPKIH